ncbi:MAG TPA: MOSC N-terminal beta barrel domain-containing protein [Mycobacterium sp.]|jgi:uncharacterized protein YcbX|nr:MOSC N-terminal beta barrel domain-containing protein [Mycobacterium sp.]
MVRSAGAVAGFAYRALFVIPDRLQLSITVGLRQAFVAGAAVSGRHNRRVRLVHIARHPVKSLQGESVSGAAITADGVDGDRCWGIRDEGSGKILTGRREPRLLFASARLAPDRAPVVTLPDGASYHGPSAELDRALSAWLAQPVRLVAADAVSAARAEYFADATDDTSQAVEWTMPAGRFVDAMPLLVLTTASLRAAQTRYPAGDWDLRRFRANLVVDVAGDGWLEDTWCDGRSLQLGGVCLQARQPCIRCTMITRPQPGLVEDRDLFRTLARGHAGLFGVWSAVLHPGTVHVGDTLRIDATSSSPMI